MRGAVSGCGGPFGPAPWTARPYRDGMWTAIVILLVAWAILSIVGFVFEGLMWLGIIGIVLFVGTLIVGFIRQSARNRKA